MDKFHQKPYYFVNIPKLMEINKDLIKNVARNARLGINEDEAEEFVPQFKEVLELFKKLEVVDTDNIEPSFHPVVIKNVLREDTEEKCLSQDDALKNSVHKKEGFFVGPKVSL